MNPVLKFALKPHSPNAVLKFDLKPHLANPVLKIYLKSAFGECSFDKWMSSWIHEDKFVKYFAIKSISVFLRRRKSYFGIKLLYPII